MQPLLAIPFLLALPFFFALILDVFYGVVIILISLGQLGVCYCFLSMVKAQIETRNAVIQYIEKTLGSDYVGSDFSDCYEGFGENETIDASKAIRPDSHEANLADFNGIYIAIVRGDIQVIKELLDAGANPNMRDVMGDSLLDLAGKKSPDEVKEDVISLLHKYGAKAEQE